MFLQQTIDMLSQSNAEMGFKLYLQAALTADSFAGSRTTEPNSELLDMYGPMPCELFTQSFTLYEQAITDPKVQQRCIVCLMGALLECKSLSKEDYERLITKTAQFSAKVLKKPNQCELVAQCAHLFYPAEKVVSLFSNIGEKAGTSIAVLAPHLTLLCFLTLSHVVR